MTTWSDLNCAYLVKAYAAQLHVACLFEKISPLNNKLHGWPKKNEIPIPPLSEGFLMALDGYRFTYHDEDLKATSTNGMLDEFLLNGGKDNGNGLCIDLFSIGKLCIKWKRMLIGKFFYSI